MDNLELLPDVGDLVQRKGTMKKGRVIDWNPKLPGLREELQKTHHRVQRTSVECEEGAIEFWPDNEIEVIAQHRVSHALGPDDFDM